MLFSSPIIKGTLIKRYKRFLADIVLETGEIVTAHCPNTGSMKGVLETPQEAWLLESTNTKRKLPYTLVALKHNNTMVGVHTLFPNTLGVEGIRNGHIPLNAEIDTIKTEVKYGTNSRVDICVTERSGTKIYIEIKNVSMTDNKGTSLFPDSITERGTKHLQELIEIKKQGDRAMMLYIAQREDITNFSAAKDIDPLYADTLSKAMKAGVEVMAYNCHITETGISLLSSLTFLP